MDFKWSKSWTGRNQWDGYVHIYMDMPGYVGYSGVMKYGDKRGKAVCELTGNQLSQQKKKRKKAIRSIELQK